MAGSPSTRVRFTTDKSLLASASSVALKPPFGKTVFFAEDEGAAMSAAFVEKNPGYVRLPEILKMTSEGRTLWTALVAHGRPWSDEEEVWWELSWRLARAARGIVNVFGPARLVQDRPLSEFKHKYVTGSYANTVFEKVELPELEANPNVDAIFYNGRPFS
jgi:hypothetical protein